MGQLQIPGTSIQFSNPKLIDQTTNIDPATGKVWKAFRTDSFNFTDILEGPPGRFRSRILETRS